MYLERTKKMIESKKLSSKKELSLLHKSIETFERLLPVVNKYDASINISSNLVYLSYHLKEDESVARTSWQIFEEMDEALNERLVNITQDTQPEWHDYVIGGNLKHSTYVTLRVYYGFSKKCKTIEKKVMKESVERTLVCE